MYCTPLFVRVRASTSRQEEVTHRASIGCYSTKTVVNFTGSGTGRKAFLCSLRTTTGMVNYLTVDREQVFDHDHDHDT